MADKSKWQRLCNEAWFAKKRGNFPEAETLLIAAVQEVNVEPEDRQVLCETLNTLANLYAINGEWTKAESTARSAVTVLRAMPEDSRILLGSGLMFLAGVLTETGQYAEAVAVAEEGVAIYSTVLGTTHPETAKMSLALTETKKRLATAS